MLHTYYYVNGQRVSMEQYMAACDNNQYQKDVFEEAKKYFEKNRWQWNSLVNTTTPDALPLAMVTRFEMTPEGEAFRKAWHEKNRKNTQRGYIIGCLIWLIVIGIGMYVALSGAQ